MHVNLKVAVLLYETNWNAIYDLVPTLLYASLLA
jgi:hypothetical protein